MSRPARFDPDGPLYAPDYLVDGPGPPVLLIDPERVRWMATNRLGRSAIDRVRAVPGAEATRLVEEMGGEARAWRRFLRQAAKAGFLANRPFDPAARRNRRESLAPRRLHEFWVVTNDHCNLRCRHCYTIERVKEGRRGLPTETLEAILAEARSLGAEIFYFTGGEPTLRPDFARLVRFVTRDARLVLFTNGVDLDDEAVAVLAERRDRVVVQISIEGPDEETNRPVRGRGTFERAMGGLRRLLAAGVRVGVSTTPNGVSKDKVHELTGLLASLEVEGRRPAYHHLILLLDRGGAAAHDDVRALSDRDLDRLLDRAAAELLRAKRNDRRARLQITNEKIFHALATHGPAKDLCGAGYTILGVSADGKLLPCAACMDDERYFLGDLVDEEGRYRPGRLRELWLGSPAVERIRRFTLAPRDGRPVRDLRYFHGGGCWKNMIDPEGEYPEAHPFAAFYERRILEAIRREASKGLGEIPEGEPLVLRAMHRGRIACAGERKVADLEGGDEVDTGYCICFA